MGIERDDDIFISKGSVYRCNEPKRAALGIFEAELDKSHSTEPVLDSPWKPLYIVVSEKQANVQGLGSPDD